jgi:hypothetical protein
VHKTELRSDYQYSLLNFMRMNELVNTRLFGLLSEPSQEVTNEQMSNAYGEFMAHLKMVGSCSDNATVLRTLNITRIEIAHLQTIFRYEQGGKCPEKSVLAKISIPY